jgi:hypothetical protein
MLHNLISVLKICLHTESSLYQESFRSYGVIFVHAVLSFCYLEAVDSNSDVGLHHDTVVA